MGYFDRHLTAGVYCPTVEKCVDLKNVKSIAWLGWNQENIVLKSISSLCPKLEISDMYDYMAENKDDVCFWDINKDWNISGYDLVICFRTSFYSTNSEHFLRNLKKTIDNNGKVIFDFILPEIQLLKDFNKRRRNDIIKHWSFDDSIEGFFSWLTPDFVTFENEGEETKVIGEVTQEQYGISLNHAPLELIASRIGGHGGYYMMPKFDDLYTKNFPFHLGCQYTERLSYFCDLKEILLQEQLKDWAIEAIGHTFNYCFNYIPSPICKMTREEKAILDNEGTVLTRKTVSELYEYPNKTCTNNNSILKND